MNLIESIKDKHNKIRSDFKEVRAIQTVLSYKDGKITQKYPTNICIDKDINAKRLYDLTSNCNIFTNHVADIFFQAEDGLDYEDDFDDLFDYPLINNNDFDKTTLLELKDIKDVKPFSMTIVDDPEDVFYDCGETGFSDQAWSYPVLEKMFNSLGFEKPSYLLIPEDGNDKYVKNILGQIKKFKFETYKKDYPVYINFEREYVPIRSHIEFLVELRDAYFMEWNHETVPSDIEFPLTAMIESREDFNRRRLEPTYRVYSTSGVTELQNFIYTEIAKPMMIFDREKDWLDNSDINVKMLINKDVDTDSLRVESDYYNIKIFDKDNTLIFAITGIDEEYGMTVLSVVKKFVEKHLR